MKTTKAFIQQIIFVWFLLINLTASAETGILTKESEYLTASELINCIEKGKAEDVLNEIYNDQTAWYDLLDKIATGNPEWLKVANGFKQVADAGASVELNGSVGEALYNVPENVLNNSLPVFSIDAICGPPDIDDTRFDSYKLANSEIDRRKAALEQLISSKLDHDIQKCMKRLDESRNDIARFYGADE